MRRRDLLGAIPALAGARSAIGGTGAPPLGRGINITGWFRFPSSRDPAALRTWLSDAALGDLRRVGFDFVRLAVDPALLEDDTIRAVFLSSVRRMQEAGLTVVVSPHPSGWQLESNPRDRTRLERFWTVMASALRPLDPARTVPEILNEPVFPHDPATWQALQRGLLAIIRQSLPDRTVMLTGHDWGSITGLLGLQPEADRHVVYSVHFYDPVELTALAAYRPGLDRHALARLPFPDTGTPACRQAADGAVDEGTRELMRYFCSLGWDRQRVDQSIGRAAAWARQHQAKVVMGEFGASEQLNQPSRLAWLRAVRGACEEQGLGWALWGYDDVMGFGLSRPPPSRPVLDPALLNALGLA